MNKSPVGQNVKPLNAQDFAKKYADRVRHGKTARDKAKTKKGEGNA